MQTMPNTAAGAPPAEPDQSIEPLVTLAGGLLLGMAVTGLVALIAAGRGRRSRAAKRAEAIREQIYALAAEARRAADEAAATPPPPPPAYPDERLGNFMRGLLLGALAGAVTGLVRARQSGAATRAQLRQALADLTQEARSAVTDFASWAADRSAATPAPEPSADDLTLTRG
jgi:gas vesicle protein